MFEFPDPDPIENLELAKHIVAQGGEAGYTDRQIELAEEYIKSHDDPQAKGTD